MQNNMEHEMQTGIMQCLIGIVNRFYQEPHYGKSVYFFVVWSFLLFGLFGCHFFCCLGGGVFFFCCLGGGPGPRPNSKKKHARAQTEKKTRPRPFRACFFLLFGRVGVFIFLLFGRGACFFLLFGRGGGGVLFFAVWAGACSFFAVWAGACFFLLFGPGACFFFCCLGGGREFTHLPVCLARL